MEANQTLCRLEAHKQEGVERLGIYMDFECGKKTVPCCLRDYGSVAELEKEDKNYRSRLERALAKVNWMAQDAISAELMTLKLENGASCEVKWTLNIGDLLFNKLYTMEGLEEELARRFPTESDRSLIYCYAVYLLYMDGLEEDALEGEVLTLSTAMNLAHPLFGQVEACIALMQATVAKTLSPEIEEAAKELRGKLREALVRHLELKELSKEVLSALAHFTVKRIIVEEEDAGLVRLEDTRAAEVLDLGKIGLGPFTHILSVRYLGLLYEQAMERKLSDHYFRWPSDEEIAEAAAEA